MIMSRHFFSKYQNENIFVNKIMNSRSRMTEVLCSDFLDLRNLCSLTDLSSLCNLTGLDSIYSPISFFKELPDPDSLSINGINMTNPGPFFVEWIIKNPNFHRYIEANLCYFFENWLVKLKFYTDTFKQNSTCIFLSVRTILKRNISMCNNLYKI